MLRQDGDYDLIYCEIPPNDVALAAAQSLRQRKGIPFVADVNDLCRKPCVWYWMFLWSAISCSIRFCEIARKVYDLCSGGGGHFR